MAARFSCALLCVLAVACTDRPRFRTGDDCALTSDCAAPLVCRLERCRVECRSTRDCRPGLQCVRDGDGFGICQLPDEAECLLASDCTAPLVCRNETCTNGCESDRDCPSGARCVDDEESGGRGCLDASETDCLLDSDCREPLICAVDGRCRDQCQTDRDCRDGRVCVQQGADRVCVWPAPMPVDAGPPIAPGPELPRLGAGERHSCTSAAPDDLRCWGGGDLGQTGTDGIEDIFMPVTVDLPGISTLDTGRVHTCAIAAGVLHCWGDNALGQLGVFGAGLRKTPTRVDDVAADAIALGDDHTCALGSEGIVCFGDNSRGQLGVGDTFGGFTPRTTLSFPSPPVQIAAGRRHTCAVLADGRLACWGDNARGQLGLGLADRSPHPAPALVAVSDVVEVACGRSHTCARREDGETLCWGDNSRGQLGLGTSSDTPIAVPARVDVPPLRRFGLGSAHSCAIDLENRLWCWGSNGSGQLAVDPAGSMTRGQPRPTRPPGVPAVEEVAAGQLHTCVRTVAFNHLCFGSNARGQLGVVTDGETAWPPQAVD